MALHVDTDFLIYALETAGWERRRLLDVAESNHALCISSVAWYEFSRGPRTPEQLASPTCRGHRDRRHGGIV